MREAKALEARMLKKLKKEGGEAKEAGGSRGKLWEAKVLKARKLGKLKKEGGEAKEPGGS